MAKLVGGDKPFFNVHGPVADQVGQLHKDEQDGKIQCLAYVHGLDRIEYLLRMVKVVAGAEKWK